MNADLWASIDTASRAVLTALDAGDTAALRRARLERASLLDRLAETNSDYAGWAARLAATDRTKAKEEKQ